MKQLMREETYALGLGGLEFRSPRPDHGLTAAFALPWRYLSDCLYLASWGKRAFAHSGPAR